MGRFCRALCRSFLVFCFYGSPALNLYWQAGRTMCPTYDLSADGWSRPDVSRTLSMGRPFLANLDASRSVHINFGGEFRPLFWRHLSYKMQRTTARAIFSFLIFFAHSKHLYFSNFARPVAATKNMEKCAFPT